MGAADDRVSELLDRWLASVELHARYLALDDAAYANVQDWPRHQRPKRWIIDLARSRCLELKRQLAERGSRGDASFADALELMAFLTSLLGSEHVERFIPLAVEGRTRAAPDPKQVVAPPPAPEPKPVATSSPPPEPAAPRAPPAQSAAATPPPPERHERTTPSRSAATKSKSSEARSSGARNPPRAASQSRTARRSETPAPQRTPERKPPATATAKARSGGHDAKTRTVIADAVRLLNWGRHWPQLASLIARLADRPAEPEVWTILRAHRAEIEAQAKPPPD